MQLLSSCRSWPHRIFYRWLVQPVSSVKKSSLFSSNRAARGRHRGGAALEGSCGAELAQCLACGAIVRLPGWPLASFLSPGEIFRGEIGSRWDFQLGFPSACGRGEGLAGRWRTEEVMSSFRRPPADEHTRAGLLMFVVNCLVLCSPKFKGRRSTTALVQEVRRRVKNSVGLHWQLQWHL